MFLYAWAVSGTPVIAPKSSVSKFSTPLCPPRTYVEPVTVPSFYWPAYLPTPYNRTSTVVWKHQLLLPRTESHSSAAEEDFGSERTLKFPATISRYVTFSELYAEWVFLASSPWEWKGKALTVTGRGGPLVLEISRIPPHWFRKLAHICCWGVQPYWRFLVIISVTGKVDTRAMMRFGVLG
jgi:hypothetical protein